MALLSPAMHQEPFNVSIDSRVERIQQAGRSYNIKPLGKKFWTEAASLVQWPLLVVLNAVLVQHKDVEPSVLILFRPQKGHLSRHLEDTGQALFAHEAQPIDGHFGRSLQPDQFKPVNVLGALWLPSS
jgi:hypothetical protein